uniref:Uncharacterized protein n=1 Tax=Romanomermis culicivorax TaxID=13658 RepID=A0A915J502_ROMCU
MTEIRYVVKIAYTELKEKIRAVALIKHAVQQQSKVDNKSINAVLFASILNTLRNRDNNFGAMAPNWPKKPLYDLMLQLHGPNKCVLKQPVPATRGSIFAGRKKEPMGMDVRKRKRKRWENRKENARDDDDYTKRLLTSRELST